MSKILVVDDSSVNNYLLENILIDRGYTLQIAYNATEAYKFLETDKPDLILLDLMMPEIDGFQMLEELQKIPEFKSIPVIIVTSKNETSDRIKAQELGASDFIVKPINIDSLLSTIQNRLKSAT